MNLLWKSEKIENTVYHYKSYPKGPKIVLKGSQKGFLRVKRVPNWSQEDKKKHKKMGQEYGLKKGP